MWWKLRFEAPELLAESAAWMIAEMLDHPVEIRDANTMSASAAQTEVVVAFGERPDDTIDKQIRDALEPLGLSEVRIETTASDDESWRDGWRAFFRGQQLSDKLWVGPPWETPASEGVSIVIEPGQAFGTGTHETTRGCLKVLEQVLSGRASQLIMDVGCGSGVLSIAAAKLGHRADGIDIDADALKNAFENVEINGVTESVHLSVGTAEGVKRTYGIVVANILAKILVHEAESIGALASDILILSGLLIEQHDLVVTAYPDFRVTHHWDEGVWRVLVMERRQSHDPS